jgi:hypothetical protein
MVQSFNRSENSHRFWNCVCDCGVQRAIREDGLLHGTVRSCGCFKSDKTRERTITHGLSKSRTYRRWLSMKDRCRPDATGKARLNYVLRGITVCDRWLHSFENFLADMGECPVGMEIERRNNDAGYSPDNCKWATRLENQHNRRVSINVTFNGKTQTLKQWAVELGLRYVTLIYRIKIGWPVERAFTTPGRRPV